MHVRLAIPRLARAQQNGSLSSRPEWPEISAVPPNSASCVQPWKSTLLQARGSRTAFQFGQKEHGKGKVSLSVIELVLMPSGTTLGFTDNEIILLPGYSYRKCTLFLWSLALEK